MTFYTKLERLIFWFESKVQKLTAWVERREAARRVAAAIKPKTRIILLCECGYCKGHDYTGKIFTIKSYNEFLDEYEIIAEGWKSNMDKKMDRLYPGRLHRTRHHVPARVFEIIEEDQASPKI